MAEFNLNEIFKSAFGYNPPKKFEIEQAADRLETSGLGGQYYKNDLLGREMFLPVTIAGMVLPFAVVSVAAKKTIVSTALPERGGTVKELISIDDYGINVKGILISDDNVFPEQQIIDLHNVFLKNESVVMECVLSDIFLKGEFDQRVVIKALNFPETAGVEHARAFEMDIESDMIFELIIE